MTITQGSAGPQFAGQSRLGTGGIALVAGFVYAIVVGGTASGELDPSLRGLNAVVAAVFLIAYVLFASRRADALDRIVLLGVVLFAVAGALSAFPRQSFDAVLASFTYAAVFFAARGALAREPMRRAFVAVSIGLSLLFTAGAALLWWPFIFEWWVLAGREVLPPLDLPLSGGQWGYRYDVGLLVVLLYPVWWIGQPSALRRVLAVLVGVIALAIVLITGSRTLWLALAVATAALGVPALAGLWSRYPRARVPVIVAVAILVAAGFAVGAAAPLVDRALNLGSLDWRLAMWRSLLDLWTERPIAGVGPGTFPLALQLTDYFDTRSWAPRHPDNAIVQVLAEGGLLGLTALLMVGGSVLWAVFRRRSRVAQWVAVVLLVASLGSNPTDFAFLVVVGIAWAAYAAPRADVATEPAPTGSPHRIATLGALVLVAMAYASTVAGGFLYESARTSIGHGDPAGAENALASAVALDPGMALYHRTLGTLAVVEGQAVRAIPHLERAVELNRGDDLAWRTLAIARMGLGDETGSAEAVTHALDAQRSDATNLLLAAQMARDAGDDDAASRLLTEVVQAWPAIVAAQGWDELRPAGVTTPEIVDRAAERTALRAPMPELLSTQDVWLGTMADRPSLRDAALDRLGGGALPSLLASSIACDPGLGDALEALPPGARRSALYWELRVRSSALNGGLDQSALQALQIMAGAAYLPEAVGSLMSPLNENSGLSGDRWAYRRHPVNWPLVSPGVPSPYGGSMHWIFDPRGAVEEAGLSDRLDAC